MPQTAAKLTPVEGAPGIFRRHVKSCDAKGRCSCSYVATWRAQGRQHKETRRTLAEAREAKRIHEADAARGEFSAAARVTLHAYALEWVDRYQGTGRRGFREETRDDYRRLLKRYVLRHFPPGLKLTDVTPRMVAEYIGWLARQPASGRKGRTLSDSSIRNAFKPLAACLATARREGLIRNNPATDAALPHRDQVHDDESRPRPFGTDEDGRPLMEMVVALIHPDHRLMFELLAATGLRRSELLALEGRHLALDGGRPYVKVRQRVRRQRKAGLVIGALKSRYARREVPLPVELADRLRAHIGTPEALLFGSKAGAARDPDNLYRRVLSPACEEAGAEWAGFHTFRHTVASRLFAEGRNVVQVQRWLGHHSASFTLDTYVHLLDGDIGEPLLPRRGNTGATGRMQKPVKAAPVLDLDLAA
jgi:integrase